MGKYVKRPNVKALLNANGFVNEWDIAYPVRSYFVSYTANDCKFTINFGWNLCAPGQVINPPWKGRPWQQKDDELSLNLTKRRGVYISQYRDVKEALARATKLCGITDWVQSPFGRCHYVSKAVLDALVKRLTNGKT